MTTTTLATSSAHRITALKILYVYTLAGAGVMGVWMLVAPVGFASALGLPEPDVYVQGIVGAVYTAFGLLAAIGLRNPEAVAPAFFLQLAYKSLWLLLVFLPAVVHGGAPRYAWSLALVFVTYIVLDLLALPFSSLTRGESRAVSRG